MTRKITYPLAVLAVAALCLFLFLGTRGLNDPDEGRFAEVSREMALQESWLMPHLCGLPHLQKPPLVYWITAAFIKIGGVNEWSVRTTSALAALGTVLMTMILASLLFGSSIAWKAGMMLLSSLLFFFMGRVITTDMLLTFWISAAVTSFVYYSRKSSIAGLCLFYLALGAGFLTKGPMAFLVPYAACIPYAFALGRRHKAPAWRWHWAPGLLVAAAIGASWFIVLARQYPGLVDYFIKYEFVDRLATNMHVRSKPVWFYSACLLGGLFPWSVLFPAMFKHLWTSLRGGRSANMWLFIGWVVIPWCILHLVVSKLNTYILPLCPPFAVLLAYVWDRYKSRFRMEIGLLSLFMAFVAAGIPVVYDYLQRNNPDAEAIRGWSLVVFLLLAAGWVAVFLGSRSRLSKDAQMLAVAAMTLVFMLTLSWRADTLLTGRNAGKQRIVQAIRDTQSETGADTVLLLGGRHYSLDFYLQTNIWRRLGSVDLCMPIPQDLEYRFVADPVGYVKKNQPTNMVVVVNKDIASEQALLNLNWRKVLKYKQISVFAPARVPPQATSP
jgi:4-amino-4-deoxy-L-arabinose transferase-like glycosyltransferase